MTEPSIERYFAVLGLPASASVEEVKEARNFVTKAFHPDKYLAGSKDQLRAHQRQIEINEAYERIMAWFEREKTAHARGSGQLSASDSPGRAGGPWGQESIIALVKIVLLLALSIGWVNFINACYTEPAATKSAASNASQSDAAGAPLADALADSNAGGQASSDKSKGRQGRPSDWLFFFLILGTLALSWFLFAPESKLLIERWTHRAAGPEPVGNQGVGPN